MAKILIVDDDDIIRELMRQMLEREGWQVEEAANGQQAINAFRSEPADLIITDIIMPDKEGIETIMELRRDYPEVKIIATSGGGRTSPDGYLKMAERFGAQKTFSKPFERAELISAVKELLN